jgi:hypothetical protein
MSPATEKRKNPSLGSAKRRGESNRGESLERKEKKERKERKEGNGFGV